MSSVLETILTSLPGKRLLERATKEAEADRLARRAELLVQRATLVAEHEKRAAELADAVKVAEAKASKATAAAVAAQGATVAAKHAFAVEDNTAGIRLARLNSELEPLAPVEIGRCLQELADLEGQTLAMTISEARADEPAESLFSSMGRLVGVRSPMKIRVMSNEPAIRGRLDGIREAKRRVASLAMEDTPDLPKAIAAVVAEIPDGRGMSTTFSWSPK